MPVGRTESRFGTEEFGILQCMEKQRFEQKDLSVLDAADRLVEKFGITPAEASEYIVLLDVKGRMKLSEGEKERLREIRAKMAKNKGSFQK